MNELQIIKGVHCYVDKDNVAQLNLEDVARGLGFTTETVSATSGKKYINVRWTRIDKHLESFGVTVARALVYVHNSRSNF